MHNSFFIVFETVERTWFFLRDYVLTLTILCFNIKTIKIKCLTLNPSKNLSQQSFVYYYTLLSNLVHCSVFIHLKLFISSHKLNII